MPAKVDPEAQRLDKAILKLQRAKRELERARAKYASCQFQVDELFTMMEKRNGPERSKRWRSKSIGD